MDLKNNQKKNLLIIYHSQSGNTEKLAFECEKGARQEIQNVRLLRANHTFIEDIEWADGIIIGTSENFGNMSGMIKDFFDRTYYLAREKEIIKPLAIFVSCDNDGRGADREIRKIANGYILKPVLETAIFRGRITKSYFIQVKELGQTFAAGISLGIF